MKKDKIIKSKRLKNVDSVAVSSFIKGLSVALPFLCLLGFVYGSKLGGALGTIIGFILGVIASLVAALIATFISGQLGELAAFIYKGPKANWSIEEQFAGDLNQVRHHKMYKRFDQALLKVDEVLTQVPQYPDALYLKASILWEGFNEPIEAKRHLSTIMKTTPKTDSCHIWASTLYGDIVKEEKNRLNDKHEGRTNSI